VVAPFAFGQTIVSTRDSLPLAPQFRLEQLIDQLGVGFVRGFQIDKKLIKDHNEWPMDKIDYHKPLWDLVLQHGDLDAVSVGTLARVERASRDAVRNLLNVSNVGEASMRYREAVFGGMLDRGYRPHAHSLYREGVNYPYEVVGGFVPGTSIFWDLRRAGHTDGCSGHHCFSCVWEIALHDVVAQKDLPGALRIEGFRFNRPDVPLAFPLDGADGLLLVRSSLLDTRVWQVEQGDEAEGDSAWGVRELFHGETCSEGVLADLATATADSARDGVWQRTGGHVVLCLGDGQNPAPLVGNADLTPDQERFVTERGGDPFRLTHAQVFGRHYSCFFSKAGDNWNLVIADLDGLRIVGQAPWQYSPKLSPRVGSIGIDADGYPLIHCWANVADNTDSGVGQRLNFALSLHPGRLEAPPPASPPATGQRLWSAASAALNWVRSAVRD
jgi:hypothetical protein